LPKPLLVVSKNFHHIEEAKVGLTGPAPIPGDKFDNQSTYATAQLNSSVSLPPPAEPKGAGGEEGQGGSAGLADTLHTTSGAPVSPGDKIPSDGLAPHTFYTYEIVFVPDLTQKYVMQIEGGVGEMRAAMNLVNGWQFTGLGPYYMKDSSTAQNVFARGVALRLGLSGAAEVVNSAANLASKAAAAGGAASVADVVAVAEAMNAAATTQDVEWPFAAYDTWEDEKVPYQRLVVDGNGHPILDANGNQQWVTAYTDTGRKVRHRLERYAEIYVYEAHLEGGQMVWRPVAEHVFDREYLGLVNSIPVGAASPPQGPPEEAADASGAALEELPAPFTTQPFEQLETPQGP
jgi:hypothetical protein